MITRCVFLFALPLAAAVVEQGPKDSAPSGLLAGVARADITPPIGIAQMNWGSQTHVGAESIDPAGFLATALVLANGNQKFVMVDVDHISAEPFEPVIARAAAATGIPAAHIRVGVSHTHAGPLLTAVKGPVGIDLAPYREVFQNYRKAVEDKIVGAIVEANSKLQPAHVGGAKGIGTINVNRRFRAANGNPPAVGRYPEGFLDRELNVLRIDDARGNPLAVIVNYQCHGTVLAFENKALSPDWIGMTRKTVERALPGSKCLYFQGAAGNQGPVEGFSGDVGVAHRLGSILGHQAAALAMQIETVRREPTFEGFVESTAYQARQYWKVKGPRDAQLKFAIERVDVPRRTYSRQEIDDMRARVERAEKAVETNRTYQTEARLRRFKDLLAQWQEPVDPTPRKVDLQVLRIGEYAIVAMPGEPFAE
ncbi:MAG: neutral/alkaline non-lysosomal ceramidase N-terminal domain-containing protein, partial [Bryobacteraceae bacterium]|nr:neutral/alkaline non-lysosomal ceramidase N-terminal domain-containing protein [Bryobacteraceae bacterium]